MRGLPLDRGAAAVIVMPLLLLLHPVEGGVAVVDVADLWFGQKKWMRSLVVVLPESMCAMM
jgi:hypothetical protein